jgi:hypothetical protein
MARSVQIGDSWIYLIVAHEWGHAIQEGIDSPLELAAPIGAASVRSPRRRRTGRTS